MFVILLRHAHYDDQGLSRFGREQGEIISEKILALIPGHRTKVLCSNSPRAVLSADILTGKLGLSDNAEACDFLHTSGGYLDGNKANKILEVIDQHKNNYDVIVMVVHYEAFIYFPDVLYSSNGQPRPVHFGEPDYSEALVINCKTWEIKKLYPTKENSPCCSA